MPPDGHVRLPNFLVIGAMKAGTTSLYHYVREHPQVYMPETKEINFFNPMRNWRLGEAWYARQFASAPPDAVAIGEASTSYTKYPWVTDAPARIRATLGDVRLIYLVRHPIERMRSHYLHDLVTGQERQPIERALVSEPMYLNVSRYALQLDQYLPFFDRDRLLIIDTRDLRARREETLHRVFTFLGVDPIWVPPNVNQEFLKSDDRQLKPAALRVMRRMRHARTLGRHLPGPLRRAKREITSRLPRQDLDVARAQLSPGLRARLVELLREDVARFREMVDPTFDGWGIA